MQHTNYSAQQLTRHTIKLLYKLNHAINHDSALSILLTRQCDTQHNYDTTQHVSDTTQTFTMRHKTLTMTQHNNIYDATQHKHL